MRPYSRMSCINSLTCYFHIIRVEVVANTTTICKRGCDQGGSRPHERIKYRVAFEGV